ncbi:MAG: stage IV sporulation protein A [Lachnospiraceae bacterium]
MEKMSTREWELYQDIRQRTNGEIFIGVVGPVRTGKSTFIKRFMELCVLPFIDDEATYNQTQDELPQAAQGKTIMTTEPKFVPAKAVEIALDENTRFRVRLIDCVGFMVQGVEGHMEDGKERMVHTPWFDTEVPFTKAARIGTEKVIHEHATLGIVMTTDGSITGIDRTNYEPAEKETVMQLKKMGKPFLIVLNCEKPFSEHARELASRLKKEYQVDVLPMNVEQMSKDDAFNLLQNLLYEFPVTRIFFQIPRWTQTLDTDQKVYQDLLQNARKLMEKHKTMSGLQEMEYQPEGLVEEIHKRKTDLAKGEILFEFKLPERCYYENISELTGEKIDGEYELIELLRALARSKAMFDKVADAYTSVSQRGYGVVIPGLEEIDIEEPQLVKHGNKYGIRIKAYSPSIHFIRANVETEIAPIIGTKEQAEGLLDYMKQGRESQEGFLNVNIFGKTVGELVEDGIKTKIAMMDEESQMKLQETMQKIVNDSNGGMVCIII